MIKMQDLEKEFGIKLTKKLGRNFQYKINIHKTEVEPNKFNIRANIMCPTSFDYKKSYEDYKMGSRTENFLMCVLDCLLFDSNTENLNIEKKEIYRNFLVEKITLEDLKKYKFESVTH